MTAVNNRPLKFIATLTLAALVTWVFGSLQFPGHAQSQENVLRVGVSGLPPGRGNPYKGVGHPHIYTWAGIFDALTVVNPTGAATPSLATSWENVDPNTWRVSLRRGVTFQNGEPFNAEAVAVTIAYVSSDEGLATAAGRNFRGYSVTAISDLRIEIKTEKPNPVLPNVLAALRVMAPKAWADLGDEGFSQSPSGTGPFELVEWAGERAILTGVFRLVAASQDCGAGGDRASGTGGTP